MELLSLSEEKLIILLQVMSNSDEINNFKNNCQNKIGIFVKLVSKSVHETEEMKRVQELRIDESSRRRLIENQDTIHELTARIRNYRIKSIVRVIREILKMLIQYAVDSPTLPVNQCFSHLIQILAEC